MLKNGIVFFVRCVSCKNMMSDEELARWFITSLLFCWVERPLQFIEEILRSVMYI